MADITIHTSTAIWTQLANAGNLYNVISDGAGNLHAIPATLELSR